VHICHRMYVFMCGKEFGLECVRVCDVTKREREREKERELIRVFTNKRTIKLQRQGELKLAMGKGMKA